MDWAGMIGVLANIAEIAMFVICVHNLLKH